MAVKRPTMPILWLHNILISLQIIGKGVFRVTSYEFDIEIPKFKMADPIWRLNAQAF